MEKTSLKDLQKIIDSLPKKHQVMHPIAGTLLQIGNLCFPVGVLMVIFNRFDGGFKIMCKGLDQAVKEHKKN